MSSNCGKRNQVGQEVRYIALVTTEMDRHAIAAMMTSLWVIVSINSFRVYWHEAQSNNTAALHLLNSEVCTNTDLRVKIKHFDQCHEAEKTCSIGPTQRALFKVGEDMYICGHGRCNILYTDITDRMIYICPLATIMALCVLVKQWREHQRMQLMGEMWKMQLPGAGVRFLKED